MQSRDDLLVLITIITDHPAGLPTGQPHHLSTVPSTSAPSPVPSSVEAIQNEGLACIAMAASIPALQTLIGGAYKLDVIRR